MEPLPYTTACPKMQDMLLYNDSSHMSSAGFHKRLEGTRDIPAHLWFKSMAGRTWCHLFNVSSYPSAPAVFYAYNYNKRDTLFEKKRNIFEVAFLLEKSVYQLIWGYTSF